MQHSQPGSLLNQCTLATKITHGQAWIWDPIRQGKVRQSSFELPLITCPCNTTEMPCLNSSLPFCNWTIFTFELGYRLATHTALKFMITWLDHLEHHETRISLNPAKLHTLHVGHCLISSAMWLIGLCQQCWTYIDCRKYLQPLLLVFLINLRSIILRVWSDGLDCVAATPSRCIPKCA